MVLWPQTKSMCFSQFAQETRTAVLFLFFIWRNGEEYLVSRSVQWKRARFFRSFGQNSCGKVVSRLNTCREWTCPQINVRMFSQVCTRTAVIFPHLEELTRVVLLFQGLDEWKRARTVLPEVSSFLAVQHINATMDSLSTKRKIKLKIKRWSPLNSRLTYVALKPEDRQFSVWFLHKPYVWNWGRRITFGA